MIKTVEAARMESIGLLAAGIAHDLNNILGAIIGHGELAQTRLAGEPVVRLHLNEVMRAADRGKQLVERILAFNRKDFNDHGTVQVQPIVEEALALLAASLPPHIRLEKVFGSARMLVTGDATQLHQIVMNLCTNAIHATGNGGMVKVALDRLMVNERRALSHGTVSPGTYVRLAVDDTGCGIPPGVLELVFNPFFTTKTAGQGTGIGLSLVHRIVADFGGVIDVVSQLGMGTTFTVWLPAAGDSPSLEDAARGKLFHAKAIR